MISFDKLFAFVLLMSKKYNIDTSHSEKHSMDVLHYADAIYNNEVENFPHLGKQTNVIYTASILHDMCDKKYLTTEVGLNEIQQFLKDQLKKEEIYYTKEIINTMSYSVVKKNGFPDLGEYQLAYHIVREADLLSSYDFDRSMIYHMNKGNSITDSYFNALQLFEKRVFNYNTEGLFLTDYSKTQSFLLAMNSIDRINRWHKFLHKI
jgi:HD superfamily phosphodiesterase